MRVIISHKTTLKLFKEGTNKHKIPPWESWRWILLPEGFRSLGWLLIKGFFKKIFIPLLDLQTSPAAAALPNVFSGVSLVILFSFEIPGKWSWSCRDGNPSAPCPGAEHGSAALPRQSPATASPLGFLGFPIHFPPKMGWEWMLGGKRFGRFAGVTL